MKTVLLCEMAKKLVFGTLNFTQEPGVLTSSKEVLTILDIKKCMQIIKNDIYPCFDRIIQTCNLEGLHHSEK